MISHKLSGIPCRYPNSCSSPKPPIVIDLNSIDVPGQLPPQKLTDLRKVLILDVLVDPRVQPVLLLVLLLQILLHVLLDHEGILLHVVNIIYFKHIPVVSEG